MKTRASLENFRNAEAQSDVGREILDQMLKETRQPRTPQDFREVDLDRGCSTSRVGTPSFGRSRAACGRQTSPSNGRQGR